MELTQQTEELIADWLIEYRSPKTRDNYRRDVTQFLKWVDNGDALTITRSDIRRWIAHLTDTGRADSTVRRKASAISSFYAHAKAEDLIDTSPATDIKRPQGESAPRYGLPADQAHRLIATAKAHSLTAHALIWLMAGAGLRISEAVAARLEDLDEDLLTVTVKGGHRQVKPLSPPVLTAIQAACEDRAEGPIVAKNGKALSRSSAWRLVETLAGRARIDNLTPHILRHTAATLALESGVPVEDVKELLGHRNIDTTLRYIRNRDVLASTRRAARMLGQALTEKETPNA